MTIFLYQIGIFILILFASFFGKNVRNTYVVLASIFTFLLVFTSWLLILQFITIFISYFISNEIFFVTDKVIETKTDNINENGVHKIINSTIRATKKTKRGFEIGCGFILMIFSLFFCISAIIKLIFWKSELGNTVTIILILIFLLSGFVGWGLTRK
ncbi:hypothetical protein [Flavobacterium stagni]|uniref:Uncharacterized protein n=1 Tax=Flavobacterium stagni TaxID=2506421 RepID=A0A4Q1KB14_9FLAO|nr:hypothetical protein [Flavobacterium stagni]RXR23495.1 hypothetical protein EQG61_05880 [Flavobacterium stagni]